MFKDVILASAAAILFCLTVPVAAVSLCTGGDKTAAESPPQQVTVQQKRKTGKTVPVSAATQEEKPKTAAKQFDAAFHLPVLLEGGVDSMPLHDYLVGALLGEMPLSFDLEALKAQAVACRTYALRQYSGRKHDPAAVCTLSSCCECWVSAEGASEENLAKAEQAVSETDGMVLTYDGKLIEATFFSCSGGRTESAADVWGNEIPYLTAVDSPGEEAAPHAFGTVRVPCDEFCRKLLSEDTQADLSGAPSTWLGAMTCTDGGGVRTVIIGGRSFTGKQLRKLFGLDSTAFQLSADETAVTFQTRGFGHRVGLSQYGAQAMAQSGADFRAILRHYYNGTDLTDCRTLYP